VAEFAAVPPPDLTLLGVVAVISVSESTVKLAAGAAPNLTDVAPPRLVPVIVTRVPPVTDPDGGAIETISGWG
jgi:hypothetical protein